MVFKPRAGRAPPQLPHPRPKGSSRPAQFRTALPPPPATRAHRRRSPSLHAQPPQPQSPPSKLLEAPAGPERAAPRTRRSAPPPALVFKRAQSSHWPVGWERAADTPGPASGPVQTTRSGRPLLAAPGREFEHQPLIGGSRGTAPPSKPRSGVSEERGSGPGFGASVVRNGLRGLGLFRAWASASLWIPRQRSLPSEATACSGLSVKVCCTGRSSGCGVLRRARRNWTPTDRSGTPRRPLTSGPHSEAARPASCPRFS